jgi:hypothetical protein
MCQNRLMLEYLKMYELRVYHMLHGGFGRIVTRIACRHIGRLSECRLYLGGAMHQLLIRA